MNLKKISIVSGGFDPIHSGHIEYIKEAKKYGDYLIVALNSDAWLKKKKGKGFLSFKERKIILENIKDVDEVIEFEDDEYGSATNALIKIKNLYPNSKLIFCNGGDRDKKNTIEMSVQDIEFAFGVGGESKLNSSSWILKEWQYSFEDRIWGKFYNLFLDENLKVKEIIVHPKKGMSLQKHHHRNELWLISKGKCVVNFSEDDPKKTEEVKLNKHDVFEIKATNWHQIVNPYDEECKIIEIQFGERTDENDIERYSYYKLNE